MFTPEQERKIFDHVKTMGEVMYGMTRSQVRKLAYDFAELEGIRHPFRGGMAGWDWYYGFLKRHPSLALRQPEAVSLNRSIGFRKTAVDRFFQNLGKVYEEHGFTAVDVWNCDETGVTTVTKPPKVLAARGSRRVSSVTSDERGVLTTLIMACNALPRDPSCLHTSCSRGRSRPPVS